MSACKPVVSGAAGGSYPSGAFNAHWFNFFNAVAFQIMMGAPVILFAKSLGASSTVLGIIASFTPLMTIFQLPAARYLGRFGYKRFVLAGWGARTGFIFALALLPLLTFLSPGDKLASMLGLLFVFNLLRGISSAAWMPWITTLIPPGIRGRFLSLDAMFIHVGCMVALFASALVMEGHVDDWEYSLVFLLSGVGGALSLVFIKRIPDIPAGETTRRSAERVPWGAILAYRPFARLLVFNVVFMTVIGSLGVFTVEYLREVPKFTPDLILFMSAFSFAGALVTLPFTGRLIDRVGSRPVIVASLVLFTCVICGWFLLAAGVLPLTIGSVTALNFFAGMGGANFHLGNSRIAMLTMPEMGRDHFFALFSVITSFGLGAAPVMWGGALDMIGTFEMEAGWFVLRRHSIFYLVVAGLSLLSVWLASRLAEPSPGAPVEPGVVYGKLKRSSRNWQR